MRLALFVTCIIATHTASALAQTFISGRVGVNYGAYLGSFFGGYSYSPITRPVITISGLVERQFTSLFSLKSGLEYGQTHAENDENFPPRTISLFFLELPLLAQWNTTIFTPSLQVFVNFGPKIRYNISSAYTDPNAPLSAASRTREIQEAIRVFDMPLELGIGIGYSIDSNVQVYADARVVRGFFNMSLSGNYPRTYVSEVRLGLGVRLRVGD